LGIWVWFGYIQNRGRSRRAVGAVGAEQANIKAMDGRGVA
jgi:hypothetical protein